MNDIQIIPLAKLKASELNVRKTGGKKIEELAASIRATGLQQNLGVVPNDKGYGVVFGGRRLRALQALKKAGELPESLAAGIPCRVLTAEEAQEASLAENTIREAMHPLDQFAAFQALVDEGRDTAEVAARFGVTETVVKQRLRLARVSKKLLQAYGAADMTLEQLQAFAVIDDHARQEAHWKQVRGGYQAAAENIRRALLRDEVSGTDGRVELIGLQAYLDAGGELRRDLFSEAVVVLDVSLLDRLVSEYVEQVAEVLRADGWGWVEFGGAAPTWDTPKIEGSHVESTDEELAELQRLEELAEERPLSPEEQARCLMLEEPVYTAEQKAVSGVRLRLRSRGWGQPLDAHTGLLRDGEQAPPLADPEDGEEDDGQEDSGPARTVQVGTHERAVKEPGEPAFSAVQRLQAEANAIVQLQVTRAPHIAIVLLVARLATDLYDGWEHSSRWVHIGREIAGRMPGPVRDAVQDGPLGQRWAELEAEWKRKLPKKSIELPRWAVEQTPQFLQQLLAFLVAREIDAVDLAAGQKDGVVELADVACVDLADDWAPTEDWLATLPKPVIVAMAKDAAGAKKAEPLAKLKKGELPAAAFPVFPARWLPKPLRKADRESTKKKPPARGKLAAAGEGA